MPDYTPNGLHNLADRLLVDPLLADRRRAAAILEALADAPPLHLGEVCLGVHGLKPDGTPELNTSFYLDRERGIYKLLRVGPLPEDPCLKCGGSGEEQA